ncbi:MAG: metallophosphoesterase [Holdemanella sp.]|nr:metallophosphoesterase [Holdemanella sp.]
MIALLLAPIYIGLHALVLYGLLKLVSTFTWLNNKFVKGLIILAYMFFVFSIGIGFVMPASQLERYMKLCGNYVLGFSEYAVLFSFGGYIISLILKKKDKLTVKNHRIIGISVIAVTLCTCLAGIYNAHNIRITPYDITVDKKADVESMKVVLIADLHLGYNIGVAHMEQMVEKINAENADVVIIAGDIFDNDINALEDRDKLSEIFRSIKTKYGVYACYGNHDIQEKILAGFTFSDKSKPKASDPGMDSFLKESNIVLMRDEYVLLDNGVYIYGRPDKDKPGVGYENRKTPEQIMEQLDASKPVIVIDHAPSYQDDLANAGVDVDLCGHTHDGQCWPGKILTDIYWDNPYGYKQYGNMHNIVTSGVGLFGPNMRVGTIAEICPITIHFKR